MLTLKDVDNRLVKILKLPLGQDNEAEVFRQDFDGWYLAGLLSRSLVKILILKFGQDFEAETCDMTQNQLLWCEQ